MHVPVHLPTWVPCRSDLASEPACSLSAPNLQPFCRHQYLARDYFCLHPSSIVVRWRHVCRRSQRTCANGCWASSPPPGRPPLYSWHSLGACAGLWAKAAGMNLTSSSRCRRLRRSSKSSRSPRLWVAQSSSMELAPPSQPMRPRSRGWRWQQPKAELARELRLRPRWTSQLASGSCADGSQLLLQEKQSQGKIEALNLSPLKESPWC